MITTPSSYPATSNIVTERERFFARRLLPGRSTALEASWIFNCQEEDIGRLVSMGTLVPLGNPVPSARKLFCTATLLQLASDPSFLDAMTTALSDWWKDKNRNRKKPSYRPAAETDPHQPLHTAKNGRRSKVSGNGCKSAL